MAYQILFFFCLLSIAHSNPTNNEPPKVYEDVKEVEENIRVARHPKFQQVLHEPPKFDYKQIGIQQDPQKIRYAQQQQMDSYIRAYQHEHNLRRKSRKHPQTPPVTAAVKAAYDTRPKSENSFQNTRQSTINTNINSFPVTTNNINNSKKKVVDPKIVPNAVNAKKSNGYKVKEEDLDTQASLREAKVYIDQEDLLKSSLSANYLAKQPTYVLANPQLNIDPKLLVQGLQGIQGLQGLQGLQYSLPENHQLTEAGFQPASKTDIEALSSLLGKTPNIQLQGLNELLAQQSVYPTASTPTASPGPIHLSQVSQVPIKEVSVEPEALLGHTPIIEPKTHVDINSHSHTHINHEVKIIPERVKSIYEGHDDDNLQYAAQYAFGYKIRDYHSGSNFGHEEVREGDVAKGHYHVLLPDGRLQNVEYWADPSGYHAKVTYSNVAQH